MAPKPKKRPKTKRLNDLKRRELQQLDYAILGLVKPDKYAKLKPGSKEFIDLQRQWYAEAALPLPGNLAEVAQAEALEADGKPGKVFEDIEWQTNPNSSYIKDPSSRGRVLQPGRELYYRLARNYLTHRLWRAGKGPREKFLWSRHTEGMTFRDLTAAYNKHYKCKVSLYTVYYMVIDIARRCLEWNKSDKEGLLNAANADSFASDVLIADFSMTGLDDDLRADMSFWDHLGKKS